MTLGHIHEALRALISREDCLCSGVGSVHAIMDEVLESTTGGNIKCFNHWQEFLLHARYEVGDARINYSRFDSYSRLCSDITYTYMLHATC